MEEGLGKKLSDLISYLPGEQRESRKYYIVYE